MDGIKNCKSAFFITLFWRLQHITQNFVLEITKHLHLQIANLKLTPSVASVIADCYLQSVFTFVNSICFFFAICCNLFFFLQIAICNHTFVVFLQSAIRQKTSLKIAICNFFIDYSVFFIDCNLQLRKPYMDAILFKISPTTTPASYHQSK